MDALSGEIAPPIPALGADTAPIAIPKGTPPFEVLVDPSAYQQVAARWAARNFVVGGLGALALVAVIAIIYRPLPGYHTTGLIILGTGLSACGLVIPLLFRRSLEAGMALAGTLTALVVVLFALAVGPTLSASVSQAAVMVAASGPILFARRYAVVILGGTLVGCGLVFTFEPLHDAPADRIVILGTQTALYAALMLWFAHTLSCLADRERQARRESEATKAELSGVDARRRNFLHQMSHELRTPLNAVIGFSEMLRLGMVGDLSPKQHEYISDIASSGTHLLALVDDVLDVGRVENGRVELSLGEFPIRRVVEDSVTLCRQEAHRSGVTVTLEPSPDSGAVTADERKVKQILLNLLANALKFTPHGGRVVIRVTRDAEDFVVSVADTGPGVPAEDRERIFHAYEQATDLDRGPAGGTGLGLAVARRLAESHGGELRLRDSDRPGSTFVLRLPVRPPTVAGNSSANETTKGGKAAGTTGVDSPARRWRGRREGTSLTARGDPGILDDGSALERLAGREGLARYRAVIAGVAAIVETLTAGALLLMPRPAAFDLEGWPWVGIAGVGAGLILLHPRSRVSANGMYVITLSAVVLTGWYVWHIGARLSPSLATLFLMEGMAAFTFFRLRRALWVGAAVAITYGYVVRYQPGNQVSLLQWVLCISLVAGGAMLARWLLGFLPALVESENRARRETEMFNGQLAAASLHKSEFLASMSHELRTPLNAIIGFADALEQEVFGPLEPKQAEYVTDIETAGRHLLVLINDILDLAKVDAGRLQLNVRQTTLGEIVASATTQAVREAAAAGVTLSINVATDAPNLDVDPQRLGKALGCVVDNAVAFTPSGGLVHVAGTWDGPTVRVDVHDSGPGIAPEDHERIFAAFEHAGERQGHAGSGIGLALARRLVDLHGGHLTVSSQPGQGSVFTIEVPCRFPIGRPIPPVRASSVAVQLALDAREARVGPLEGGPVREHGHDDDTLSAQRATTLAPRKSERKPPEGQMLDLQRKLGNTALTRAVHSGRLADLGVHSSGQAVQREADETEEADDEEAFDGAEVAGNATDDEETFDGAETADEEEDEEAVEDAKEEGAGEEEVLADEEKVLKDKAEEAEDEGAA